MKLLGVFLMLWMVWLAFATGPRPRDGDEKTWVFMVGWLAGMGYLIAQVVS